MLEELGAIELVGNVVILEVVSRIVNVVFRLFGKPGSEEEM